MENYNIEELYGEELTGNQTSPENTFLGWLGLTKTDNFVKQFKIKHQQDLISSFIETAPKIQPVKGVLKETEIAQNPQPGKSRKAELIVSETLAKVYQQQKKYQLAIETYKKLRLVYPEKSSYFAGLIKKIEKEAEVK